MSSPANDAGAVPGSSNLILTALSTLVLAPVLHGLVSLIVTVGLSLASPVAPTSLGPYLAFAPTLFGFDAFKCFYLDLRTVHPILCFVLLPAFAMMAIDQGGTSRRWRFALYVAAAGTAAGLVRLCGCGAGLGWFAALSGLCSAFVFETTPKVVRRWQRRRGA